MCVALVLGNAVAMAQEAAPPPPPPPSINLATPPPPPLEHRTYHTHDGFYLRMSLGPSYVSTAVSAADATVAGASGSLDLLIGGTPATGLTIGGGFLADSAPNPGYSAGGGGQTLDRSMGVALVGPFVDGFVDPRNGFHVGGMLGGATLVLGKSGNQDSTTYNGGGAELWVGYDAWIAADWSIGGMLRLGGARLSRSESGVTDTATARNIALVFTALYH